MSTFVFIFTKEKETVEKDGLINACNYSAEDIPPKSFKMRSMIFSNQPRYFVMSRSVLLNIGNYSFAIIFRNTGHTRYLFLNTL